MNLSLLVKLHWRIKRAGGGGGGEAGVQTPPPLKLQVAICFHRNTDTDPLENPLGPIASRGM